MIEGSLTIVLDGAINVYVRDSPMDNVDGQNPRRLRLLKQVESRGSLTSMFSMLRFFTKMAPTRDNNVETERHPQAPNTMPFRDPELFLDF